MSRRHIKITIANETFDAIVKSGDMEFNEFSISIGIEMVFRREDAERLRSALQHWNLARPAAIVLENPKTKEVVE